MKKQRPAPKKPFKLTPGYAIEGVGPGVPTPPMSGGTRPNIRKPAKPKRGKGY